MTPVELVQKVYQHSGLVTVDGGDLNLTATRPLPVDLLDELRAHKAELLDHLNGKAANAISDADPPLDPAAETRRRQVLAMLAAHPGVTYAIVTDDECAPDFVVLTLAIRGKATAELQIPKAKYNGLAILQLIDQHASGASTYHPVVRC